jgi:hypothetical protein
MDTKGKWLEASVVDIDYLEKTFVVHFKGYSSKWDEIVSLDNSLIGVKYAEIGLYSGAYGFAKYNKDLITDQKS